MDANKMISMIFAFNKKGDKTKYSNYRGMSLINSPYNIFLYMLINTLTQPVENFLVEYQGGFRQLLQEV